MKQPNQSSNTTLFVVDGSKLLFEQDQEETLEFGEQRPLLPFTIVNDNEVAAAAAVRPREQSSHHLDLSASDVRSFTESFDRNQSTKTKSKSALPPKRRHESLSNPSRARYAIQMLERKINCADALETELLGRIKLLREKKDQLTARYLAIRERLQQREQQDGVMLSPPQDGRRR